MRNWFICTFLFLLQPFAGKATQWEDPYFEEAVKQSSLICVGKVNHSNPRTTTITLLNIFKGAEKTGDSVVIHRSKIIGVGHSNDHLEQGDTLFFMLKSRPKSNDYTSHTDSYWHFYVDKKRYIVPIRDPSSYIEIERSDFETFLRLVVNKSIPKDAAGFVNKTLTKVLSAQVLTKKESAIELQVFGFEVLYYFGTPDYTPKISRFLASPYYQVRWSCLRAIGTCKGKGADNELLKALKEEDIPIIQHLLGKEIFNRNITAAKPLLEKLIPETSNEPIFLSADFMSASVNTEPYSARSSYIAALMKLNGESGSFENLIKHSEAYIKSYKNIQLPILEGKKYYYELDKALAEPDSVYVLSLKRETKKDFELSPSVFPNLKDLSVDGFDSPGIFTHLSEFGLIELSLSNLKTKEIPKEVFECETIEKLSISLSKIKALPPEIGKLKNLKILDLRINDLDSLPKEIGMLQHLREIDLYGNKFSKFPEILLKCNSLKRINLSSNRIKELPSNVQSSANLRFIDLSYNKLTSKEITKIEKLNAHIVINTERGPYRDDLIDALNDPLSGGKELVDDRKDFSKINTSGKRLRKYESVKLTRYNLTQIPFHILDTTSLQKLNLSNNQIKTIPDSIEKLALLTELNLSHNAITAIPGNLKNVSLEILDLSNNPIKDFTPLDSLTMLRRLHLENNNIFEFPDVLTRLPQLSELYLSRNFIAAVPMSLANMKLLYCLDLSNNALSEFPKAISELKIFILNLSHNAITEVPEDARKIKNFNLLNLSYNKLIKFPEVLSDININTLWLNNNQMESISAGIGKMKPLQYLDLRNNKLTSLPNEIGAIGLKKIELNGNNFSEEEKKNIENLLPASCEIIW